MIQDPNLVLGADLVADSGGKIIRGLQTAGVGRRDLAPAGWANSPHHACRRALKVSKEEVVGMQGAVETWRTERDIHADFREWNSWYQHIMEQVTRLPGVRAEVRPPARGGTFPTRNVSRDTEKVGLSAGEVGRQLLEGKPRIMSQADGDGCSFLIRPVARRSGEYKILAQRLYEIFRSAPKGTAPKPQLAAPAVDLSGSWEVEVEYEVGGARHSVVIASNGNELAGWHQGWAYKGELRGKIDGNRLAVRSSFPAEGTLLAYTFRGEVNGGAMAGTLELEEYGHGRWRAKRRV